MIDSNLVFEEKIKTLRDQTLANIFATVVSGSVLAFAMTDSVLNNSQYGWLLMLWIVKGMHFFDWKYTGNTSCTRQYYSFLWASLFTGLLWAAFLILFIDVTPYDKSIYLSAAVICGLIAASLTSTSLFPKLYYSYSLPMVVTFTGVMIWIKDAHHLLVGGLLIFFYLMISTLAGILNKRMTESVELRFENIEMLKQLQLQKEIAEQANISKSKFLASASHDLRQPLHALAFFFEALKMSSKKTSPLFKKINTSMSSLEVLFDSLLDVSRLDAGVEGVDRTHFELSKLLARIKDIHEPNASAKNLKLVVDEASDVVFSDVNHVERILNNLITNAVRYTEKGEVHISINNVTSSDITITVSDTGVGISEHELENIFDEFYQLSNPERDRRKGLGLGLSIVRRLSDLLDTKISVESTIGKGTAFSIVLPLGVAELVSNEDFNTTSVIDMPYQKRGLYGKRILLVDDELDIREAMEAALNNWGCDVLCCESGVEALNKVQEQRFDFDLVISDMRLRDDENGISVIDSLLSIVGKRDTPALLISGDTAVERLEEIQKSGYRLLHKPLRPAVLRLHLVNLLQ